MLDAQRVVEQTRGLCCPTQSDEYEWRVRMDSWEYAFCVVEADKRNKEKVVKTEYIKYP